MSNFKLKAEDWPHSETKLKSARDVNTLKDKFAFFMQRIDKRQSKELKDPISKRESLVSNDSADFSFDKSTSPYKQFQKVSTTNTMRLSLKPKPKFSLFEENLKSSKKSDVSQVLDNDNTKPRETLPHSRSFSLTMPFSFKFRLSLPQIERNISEITSSYKSIVEEIESLKQELQSQKTNLDSITSEEAIILSTIKETRDGRNKLIAEKVMLENEIDFLKVFYK
jgi:vacuolar-type H+-ATPase subunit I/STV1